MGINKILKGLVCHCPEKLISLEKFGDTNWRTSFFAYILRHFMFKSVFQKLFQSSAQKYKILLTSSTQIL